MPAELDKYLVGENADGVAIVRSDEKVADFLRKFFNFSMSDSSLIPNFDHFQNGLILFNRKGTEGTMAAVLQFESSENAEEVKNWPFSDDSIDLDIDDNVIVLSKGEGLKGFSGSLYDNPLFEKIPSDLLDSQLIFYADSEVIHESNLSLATIRSSLFSNFDEEADVESINVLAYAKFSGLFMEFSGDTLNASFINTMIDKKEFGNFEETPSLFYDNIMTYEEYEENLEAFNASLPFIEKLFIDLLDSPDKAQIEAELDGLDFSLTMTMPTDALFEMFKKRQAKVEGTSLDLSRIIHLQSIERVLVQYSLMTGEYPGSTGCVDDIVELRELLKEAMLIDADGQFNLNGEQEFDGIVCASGYYYKIVSGKGFLLWAKMENEENGNFSLGPEAIDADYDFSENSLSNSGEYYLLFFEDEYAVADEEKVER